MGARRLTALLIAVLVCAGGYGALVATGQVRGFREPVPEVDLSARLSATSIEVLLGLRGQPGDRRDNHGNEDLPQLAPIVDIDLVPEEPEWWRNRCHGFFSALFRARLDLSYLVSRADEPELFPELSGLPDSFLLPDFEETPALDQMRRYERSWPLDPEVIRNDPLYLIDLPLCLRVAKGDIPQRGE